jgi:hypothetical protein
MDGNQLFMLLFGFILLAYVVLYLRGRKYLLENFADLAGSNSPTSAQLYPIPIPVAEKQPEAGRVLMEYTTKDPVVKDAINSLDDYEYNMIYQNESDRSLSQAMKNKLMSQRPLEWAGLPPSSSQFQAGLRESFENAKPTVPDNAEPFNSVNGGNMIPPDTASTEMEERKVLQSYTAPSTKELSSYNPDEDPEVMIKKLYDVKGLIPTVAHKEGTNVYEVIGVRRKDEKVVYEDEEAPASIAPVQRAGEARITVPPTAYDTAAAMDPYYDTTASTGRTRIGKWDYQAWTPGLERMFAPTGQTQAWT